MLIEWEEEVEEEGWTHKKNEMVVVYKNLHNDVWHSSYYLA